MAVVEVVTAVVVTVNAALVLPALTLTVAGTVAEELLLDKETDTPPIGAGPLKVTVPVAVCPPRTEAGLTDSPASVTAGGLTVIENVELEPE